MKSTAKNRADFPNGTRVRLLDTNGGQDTYGLKVGDTGIIFEEDPDTTIPDVQWDKGVVCCAALRRLEKIEPHQTKPNLKATFSVPRKEVEALLKSYLETSYGIKLGSSGFAFPFGEKIAVEAEVTPA